MLCIALKKNLELLRAKTFTLLFHIERKFRELEVQETKHHLDLDKKS